MLRNCPGNTKDERHNKLWQLVRINDEVWKKRVTRASCKIICIERRKTYSMTPASRMEHGKMESLKQFLVTYPKRRGSLDIPFKDLIYQGVSMITPFVLKWQEDSLHKLRLPDRKRNRFCKDCPKDTYDYFYNYSLDGWMVQIDIHGYCLNMRHSDVMRTRSQTEQTKIQQKCHCESYRISTLGKPDTIRDAR